MTIGAKILSGMLITAFLIGVLIVGGMPALLVVLSIGALMMWLYKDEDPNKPYRRPW